MAAIRPMLRASLVFVLGMAVAAPADAQAIFKCFDGEATSYQSTPCAAGVIESRLTPERVARADGPSPSEIPSASSSSRPGGSWRDGWPARRSLALGMSDDEVLNLAGWGIPTHIVRTRKAREWREEWVYARPADGERRLRFVNAKLVDVDEAPANAQLASSSPR